MLLLLLPRSSRSSPLFTRSLLESSLVLFDELPGGELFSELSSLLFFFSCIAVEENRVKLRKNCICIYLFSIYLALRDTTSAGAPPDEGQSWTTNISQIKDKVNSKK